MSKSNFTFEQLCIRNENGFSFDLGTMFLPSNPNTFDDVVFKLISKIDTSLLLLKTHCVEVENFTIIALPISSHEIPDQNCGSGRKSRIQPSKSPVLSLANLQNAWDFLGGEGWHGLQSLSLLNADSMPMNGSRKYSLYQYLNCIMDVIRANYMFQKYKPNFHPETLEIFDDDDMKNTTQAVFGLLWRRTDPPLKESKIPNILFQKRKNSSTSIEGNSSLKKVISSRLTKVKNVKENRQISSDEDTDYEEREQMEVDDEISFKNPVPSFEERLRVREENVVSVSQTSQKGRSTRKSRSDTSALIPTPTPPPITIPPPLISAPVTPDPQNLNDVPLGFELSVCTQNSVKGSRKSMGRKSLSSEWPDEERSDILRFYDNLNPKASEQKRIALTCKYVSLCSDKELPSKLLYQWIQKKGREILRTVTSFLTPEGEQEKPAALKVFRDLSENCSETARVNYTIKYLDVQYGLNISSKQFYDWLNEKPTSKKGAKRR